MIIYLTPAGNLFYCAGADTGFLRKKIAEFHREKLGLLSRPNPKKFRFFNFKLILQ